MYNQPFKYGVGDIANGIAGMAGVGLGDDSYSGIYDTEGNYIGYPNPSTPVSNLPVSSSGIPSGSVFNNPVTGNTTYTLPSIYSGSGTPVNTNSGGNTTSSWLTALTSAIGSASSILGTRYAVPQLSAGQYIQTGPNGTVMYQQPAGSTSSLLPSSLTSLTSVGSESLLLIGGIALVALMIFKK